MMPATKLTRLGGLVLAGGAGRRLGGDKALWEYDGTPLVTWAIGLLRPHCEPIIVAGRPTVALPANLGVPVVHDDGRYAGPVAGVAAGLSALDADDVVVLACDLPLAGPAIALLAAHPAGRPAVAVTADGVQPLCARVPRAGALAAAEQLLGESTPSARALMALLHADRLDCPAAWLTNLNTPDDAHRAETLRAVVDEGQDARGVRWASLS